MSKVHDMLSYPSMELQPNDPYEGIPISGRRGTMPKKLYVMDAVIVDRVTCEIIRQQAVIGDDSGSAMLDLDLTKADKKLLDQGKWIVLKRTIGEFTPYRELSGSDVTIVSE